MNIRLYMLDGTIQIKQYIAFKDLIDSRSGITYFQVMITDYDHCTFKWDGVEWISNCVWI